MRRAGVLLLVAFAPLAAGAEPRPIHHDLRVDAAVTAAAVAAWIASEAAKGRLAPSACRVCGPGRLDAGARAALVWRHGGHARHAANLLAFGVVPAAVGAHQLLAARGAGDAGAGLVDLLVVAQAAALALDLDQAVKLAVGRQRPFVRHSNWREPDRWPDPDDNLSFFSGHTTLAFSLAAGAGTVSTLRGYDGAGWVWAAGLTLASSVGYLRIASDDHYLTDVLVGAIAGSAIGIAAPRLLHGRKPEGGGVAEGTGVPFALGVAMAF